MKRAKWSEAATNDFEHHYNTIGRHDADAAERVGRAILVKAAWSAEFPFAGSAFKDALRKTKVHGTPYLILYQPDQDGILVVRLYHEREDWRRS